MMVSGTQPDSPAPEHLTLGEVIARLEREDPAKQVSVGFARPHSYRGYYEQLAFEVERDTTVGAMLAAAQSALGATFQGWKGGDYEMRDYTDCWLVPEEGTSVGETIGAVLLEFMLGGREGGGTGAGSVAPGLTGSLPGASDSESGQNDSGQLGATFDCPACMPEDLPYCDHRPGALPLAWALAVHFQGVAEPSREQMGWFLDDAGSLLKDAGPGPYTVRKLGEGWHSEHAFLLNNLVVTIGEGGKDCPAQPEVAAVLPEGHALVRVSVDDDTVERVARAISATAGDYTPWSDLESKYRADYLLMAFAAVQALRDGGEA